MAPFMVSVGMSRGPKATQAHAMNGEAKNNGLKVATGLEHEEEDLVQIYP